MIDSSPPQLTLTPIGVIHTRMRVRFDAPHQPKDGCDEQNRIELFGGHNFEQALQDLSGFDRIWLIWWCHRNTTWRPQVLPPRGSGRRRGVFATRSPHRPNPIGLTAVPLLSIKKRTLIVGNTDLLDGTPILDIKPYLPGIDAFPDASSGWVADIEEELSAPPIYSVVVEELAKEQLDWLKQEWRVDPLPRATELLARDPRPYRTRRISKCSDGTFRIGCGAWKLNFSVLDTVVSISSVSRGYPERTLHREGYNDVPDREAQIAFGKMWGEPQLLL